MSLSDESHKFHRTSRLLYDNTIHILCIGNQSLSLSLRALFFLAQQKFFFFLPTIILLRPATKGSRFIPSEREIKRRTERHHSRTAYLLIFSSLFPFIPKCSRRAIFPPLRLSIILLTVSSPMPGTFNSASLSAILILTG